MTTTKKTTSKTTKKSTDSKPQIEKIKEDKVESQPADSQKYSEQAMALMLQMQQGELDEAVIYARIAKRVKDEQNRQTLQRISMEESNHAFLWQGLTGQLLVANHWKVGWHSFIARLFGYTFAIKKMEMGEGEAQKKYEILEQEVPQAVAIHKQEEEHEAALIGMLDEERLHYVSSMVLGLNDALVELTGTLAGLTFSLQNTRVIALSGLITGVAATLSMAASEYLSASSEDRSDALKSCVYTGIAYLVTVAILIFPYLLFANDLYWMALIVMLISVVLIIAVFNYYVAVARGIEFKKRFAQMCSISLGVALISYLIGLLCKALLGVDL